MNIIAGRLFVILAVILASCGGQNKRGETTPLVAPLAAKEDPSIAPSEPTACQKLEAIRNQTFSALPQKNEKGCFENCLRSPQPDGTRTCQQGCQDSSEIQLKKLQSSSGLPFCISNPDGKTAWALIPTAVQYEGETKYSKDRCCGCNLPQKPCIHQFDDCIYGDQFLHFVDEQGVIHKGPKFLYSADGDGFSYNTTITNSYDYDGDGIYEIAVENERAVWEEKRTTLVTLFTFKTNKVQPYAPTQSFEATTLEDINGDGLNDLVLPYRFGVGIQICHADPWGLLTVGPEFVAHARKDGTFSIDDDVALKRWYATCPAPPTEITPPVKDTQFDNAAFKQNLMCAILWGDSAGAQDALNDCHATQVSEEMCPSIHASPGGEPLYKYDIPTQCADKIELQKWIENPPPVTLKVVSLSICGTLTSAGYPSLSLIVPEGANSPQVKRYEVIDGNVFPPIEVNDGWWVCVTEGRILEHPNDEERDSYGKIIIHTLESTQTNGEKGQE